MVRGLAGGGQHHGRDVVRVSSPGLLVDRTHVECRVDSRCTVDGEHVVDGQRREQNLGWYLRQVDVLPVPAGAVQVEAVDALLRSRRSLIIGY